VLLAFAGYVMTEKPFDPTMYLWFGVIPHAATGMLGEAQGRRWALIAVLVAVFARVVSLWGWVTPSELHTSLLVSEVRALAVGATLFAFVQRFDAERQAAVREARSADQLKSRFLANMSHEIRTPLNGILGMTQAVLLTPLAAALREPLELIQRSGMTLVALLNDLLDVSKIEAGKLSLSEQTFAFRRMLEDLRALFAPLGEQKGVAVELEVAGDVPAFLRGDAQRLEQVLRNLVGNAVKFTSHGTVRLKVSRAASGRSRFRFEVQDTGIGIPEAALARLFRRFEQVDQVSHRYGGTGLGLSLSESLLCLMGGKLEVKTEQGKGSLFWFELELGVPVEALPLPAAPAVRGVRALQRSSAKVLVVDDNPINLMVACALVKRAGFETERASSGEQAIAAVTRERFLLVLMDCHMPDVDGLEATRAIRALGGQVATTRIVALTASAMPEELRACIDAGMDATLVKPLMYEQLVQMLQEAQRLQGAHENHADLAS
jgi:signal transduction histidine kinase/CheY-like chemotaxis protein